MLFRSELEIESQFGVQAVKLEAGDLVLYPSTSLHRELGIKVKTGSLRSNLSALIEALQKFHHYYGDDFKVECPTGSGVMMTINEVADELARRLKSLFLRDAHGRRPVFGDHEKLQTDPQFRDYVLFYEYFHGDNGRGVGASHQTGWTALVAKLIQRRIPAKW